MDRASATETMDMGSILGYKNWYSQVPYLTFSNKRDSVKQWCYSNIAETGFQKGWKNCQFSINKVFSV